MSWLRRFVDSAYLVWMLDFVIGQRNYSMSTVFKFVKNGFSKPHEYRKLYFDPVENAVLESTELNDLLKQLKPILNKATVYKVVLWQTRTISL